LRTTYHKGKNKIEDREEPTNMRTQSIYTCKSEHGVVLNHFNTLENAKASWNLTYSNITSSQCEFVQFNKDIVHVFTNNNKFVGSIEVDIIFFRPEHL
jgi:hypothetical protein